MIKNANKWFVGFLIFILIIGIFLALFFISRIESKKRDKNQQEVQIQKELTVFDYD